MSDSTGGMSDLDDMDDIEMIMQQLQSEQEQAAEVHTTVTASTVNVKMPKNVLKIAFKLFILFLRILISLKFDPMLRVYQF
nr:hypothetical protein [Tanacetum cinerariifolium]